MLRQRVITALIIGLPVLALLLYAPAVWLQIALGIILLLGAWEWSGFVTQQPSVVVRLLYVLLIAALMAAWYFKPTIVSAYTLLFAAVLWWIVASAWIVFAPHSSARWMTPLIGIVVLLPVWIALGTLLMNHSQGAYFILCLLLLVVSTDVGAYFFGKAFGRHKLAAQVSPGKTWEGVVGGVLSAMVVALLAAHWFGIQLFSFALLSLITVSFSIVGDLTESLFKRHAGLKDSSNILPGHGGVLDRIDSITAAAPVFVYGLIYLNVVTL